MKSGISAAKGKGASVEKSAELMKLVGAAPQSRDVCFAVRIDPPPPADLAYATTLRGGVDLEKGIDVPFVVTMDSPAEAEKLARVSKTKLEQAKAEPQAKMLGIDAIASKVTFVANTKDVEVKIPHRRDNDDGQRRRRRRCAQHEPPRRDAPPVACLCRCRRRPFSGRAWAAAVENLECRGNGAVATGLFPGA